MRRRRHGRRALAILASAVVALSTVLAGPAQAQINYQLWFYHSQKCVDLQYGNPAPNTKVQQWTCANPGNSNFGNQQWVFHFIGTTQFAHIRHAHNSDACLQPVGESNGSSVLIASCDLGQRWVRWRGTRIHDGDQDYFLMQNDQTSRCLDIPRESELDGERLQIWDCNGNNRQQWLSWATDKP